MRRVPDLHAERTRRVGPCRQLWRHRLWAHQQGLGYSYHWGSRAKAESVAMQNCGQHGNDCEVMVWFDRRCGAVAAGEGTTAFWCLGRSDSQARADAQNKCVNGGGKDCEIQVSRCSN
jgi:hypothetical protein